MDYGACIKSIEVFAYVMFYCSGTMYLINRGSYFNIPLDFSVSLLEVSSLYRDFSILLGLATAVCHSAFVGGGLGSSQTEHVSAAIIERRDK